MRQHAYTLNLIWDKTHLRILDDNIRVLNVLEDNKRVLYVLDDNIRVLYVLDDNNTGTVCT